MTQPYTIPREIKWPSRPSISCLIPNTDRWPNSNAHGGKRCTLCAVDLEACRRIAALQRLSVHWASPLEIPSPTGSSCRCGLRPTCLMMLPSLYFPPLEFVLARVRFRQRSRVAPETSLDRESWRQERLLARGQPQPVHRDAAFHSSSCSMPPRPTRATMPASAR
jgi:hypothetical protein